MSYGFKRLSEVEALTEVPDGTNMIAEVGGEIRRVPAATGGGTGDSNQPFVALVRSSGLVDSTYEEVVQAINDKKIVIIVGDEIYTDLVFANVWFGSEAIEAIAFKVFDGVFQGHHLQIKKDNTTTKTIYKFNTVT